MEKDIDEVGKIARNVKAKIEAINNEVNSRFFYIWITQAVFELNIHHLKAL